MSGKVALHRYSSPGARGSVAPSVAPTQKKLGGGEIPPKKLFSPKRPQNVPGGPKRPQIVSSPPPSPLPIPQYGGYELWNKIKVGGAGTPWIRALMREQ